MKNKHIVFVVMPNSLSFDLIGPSEVFNLANEALSEYDKLPEAEVGYTITFASAIQELELTLDNGLVVKCQKSVFDIKEDIDTIIIAGFSRHRQWKTYKNLYEWLEKKSKNVRRIASVCVGAFALAEAGLLDGRQATTHWNSCREFQNSYSKIKVVPNSIFVKDQGIYTSAGVSCGVDLALALVEEDYNKSISLRIAHYLVLYVKRSGDQSQFSFLLEQQFSEKQPIRKLQEWIINNISKDLKTSVLAENIAMSERNFVRVFEKETGMTPTKYVEKVRLENVRQLLMETSLTLERIADSCGFVNKEVMSKAFKRYTKLTPSQYRQYLKNN
ncbi:MAG: helix-turn-helix domain-containing protein [Flavobacteriaceae bacterium]|jgi:transcriptional regulator GlxA family with amidase domain|nr:helix-turn-helix domain-containing protein [Flavobacteriaceae bacterium]